ncbi:uncharacterized protein LOC108937302 isoform X2 [Scleropages formosus]|nr:uncharacterized protein LOC108937302 isoform X2 [Scleropages formosus]
MSETGAGSLFACIILLCASSIAQTAETLMKLEVRELLTVPCNQDIDLDCNIISFREPVVNSMSWQHHVAKPRCIVNDTKPADGPQCTYTKGKQLVLHLHSVTPAMEGEYTCKILSNQGIKSATSIIKLEECYSQGSWSSSGTELTCWFPGVYPEGTIHWFSEGRNVTEDAVMAISRVDRKGLFNVSSTLHDARSGGLYTCTLWIPSTGRTLGEVHMEKIQAAEISWNTQLASGGGVGLGQQLPSILLLVSILMV